jgi:hypothetical protein
MPVPYGTLEVPVAPEDSGRTKNTQYLPENEKNSEKQVDKYRRELYHEKKGGHLWESLKKFFRKRRRGQRVHPLKAAHQRRKTFQANQILSHR